MVDAAVDNIDNNYSQKAQNIRIKSCLIIEIKSTKVSSY